MTVVDLLADVMAEVTVIEKRDRNDFHNFTFRGIDAVIDTVGPALRKYRVLCVPKLLKLDSRDVTTEKGKTAREVTVEVEYTFIGPEGDRLPFTVPGEAQDLGDKAVSKAMSVAYRTGMIQALNIPTRELDPDAHTYRRGPNLLDAWRGKAKQLAEQREWSMEQLAYEYQSWSEGGDVYQAEADKLQAFCEHLDPSLKPPRKTVSRQRKQPEAAGE